MIKITTTVLVAAAMLTASAAFAGDKACCVKGASNKFGNAQSDARSKDQNRNVAD